jgi:hypothetical protein
VLPDKPLGADFIAEVTYILREYGLGPIEENPGT